MMNVQVLFLHYTNKSRTQRLISHRKKVFKLSNCREQKRVRKEKKTKRKSRRKRSEKVESKKKNTPTLRMQRVLYYEFNQIDSSRNVQRCEKLHDKKEFLKKN